MADWKIWLVVAVSVVGVALIILSDYAEHRWTAATMNRRRPWAPTARLRRRLLPPMRVTVGLLRRASMAGLRERIVTDCADKSPNS